MCMAAVTIMATAVTVVATAGTVTATAVTITKDGMITTMMTVTITTTMYMEGDGLVTWTTTTTTAIAMETEITSIATKGLASSFPAMEDADGTKTETTVVSGEIVIFGYVDVVGQSADVTIYGIPGILVMTCLAVCVIAAGHRG